MHTTSPSVSTPNPQLSTATSVYNNRGHSYAGLSRHQRAKEDCNQAIIADSNLAVAYANRAQAFTFQDKDNEAQRDVDRAVGLGFNRGTLDKAIGEIKTLR